MEKKMKYEIVELKEKIVAGLSDVTSNDSPDMSSKIASLWQNLYSAPEKIKNRSNSNAIGLYCDYGKPSEKDYTVLAGFEVEKVDSENEKEFAVKKIPAGRYAKFSLRGDVVKAVAEAWGEIWNTPLERTFTGDFEEYMDDCDGKERTINIYLAIK